MLRRARDMETLGVVTLDTAKAYDIGELIQTLFDQTRDKHKYKQNLRSGWKEWFDENGGPEIIDKVGARNGAVVVRTLEEILHVESSQRNVIFDATDGADESWAKILWSDNIGPEGRSIIMLIEEQLSPRD